jgi:hypothetical protein
VHIREFPGAIRPTDQLGVLDDEIHLRAEKKESNHLPRKTTPQSREEDEEDTVHDPSRRLRRSVADTTSEPAQNLVDRSIKKVSENVTPDELDDGEEPSLKRIAVAKKGKEPPSSAAVIAESSQQQFLGQSDVDSSGSKVPGGTPARDKSSFPLYSEYKALDAMADILPDVVHIPFQESTSDVILQGWEDKWFSAGIFDSSRWGILQEPKIDFIYTCK